MKKTVILTLLIAPLILIYIISFAGRVLGNYAYIYVERVVFLDEEGEEYNFDDTITLNLNEQKQINVKVFPELAHNKHHKFIINENENVFSIDKDGVLTALQTGISRLTVQTTEKSLTNRVRIVVLGSEIEKITLNEEEVELGVGSRFTLSPTIYPANTSTSRNIVWESANKEVAEVNANGVITAKSAGQTTISATTANGKQAIVEVTVLPEKSAGVYFNSDEGVIKTKNNKFNLHSITEIVAPNNEFGFDNLGYTIVSGNQNNNIVLEKENNEVYINFNDNKDTIIVVVKVEVIGTSYEDNVIIVFSLN